MKKDIAEATEILFDLVSVLEPRMKPLESWFRELCSTCDKWYSSEGNQGIKRAKDILGQAWLAILGEDTQVLDFVKSDSHGIPQLVLPLVTRVKPMLGKDGARLLSATMSLIRVTDLWIGIPTDYTVSKQLEVIQASSLPKSAKAVIDEFSEFVHLFMTDNPGHPLVKAFHKSLTLDDSDTLYYKESRGPNGALIVNAHKDVKTLMEARTSDGSSLLGSIRELQQEICNQVPMSWRVDSTFSDTVVESMTYDTLEVSSSPGKINFVAEKSGKVRLIAQPDYYTQLAMKPVHRWAMNVLRSTPSDCTYDQRSSIDKISTWQLEGRYMASFDQSSCTDLFPLDMQLQVISERFGEPLTESFKTVMSDRDWEVILPQSKTVKKIRWSVGQPMGMLMSWPLMALTHHLLVQFAFWKSSGKPKGKVFDKYVICGDDIVIADRSVADAYVKLVKQLGMRINMSKSHITGGGTNIPPVSEFAKITIWKGQPLFGIRPNMVLAAVKDWRNCVPLLIDLANVKGFNMKLKPIERFVKRRFPQGRRFLVPLLTIPREFGGVGYRDNVPMKRKFSVVHAGQVHPFLIYLARKIRSGIALENRILKVEPLESIVTEDYYHSHPLVQYANQKRSELNWTEGFRLPRNEKLPSVRSLVRDLLVDGIGPYSRFLYTDRDLIGLPDWDESVDRERKRDRTLWEQALKQPVTLRPEDLSYLIGREYPKGITARVIFEYEAEEYISSHLFNIAHTLYVEAASN